MVEIIIGHKMPIANRENLINAVKGHFPHGIPIYEVIPKSAEFGLDKRKLL